MTNAAITPGMRLPPEARPRLGFLYPRGGSAFEYYRFAEDMGDNVRCYLIGGMHRRSVTAGLLLYPCLPPSGNTP